MAPPKAGLLILLLSYPARLVLWALGWRIEGGVPDLPKYVLIIAPHTSRWDAIIWLAMVLSLRIPVRWFAKHTLFWPPFGWLLRALGGISIDRRQNENKVLRAVRALQEHDEMILGLAPEGTRSYRDSWRSGFYYIAVKAEVPIVMAYTDFTKKVGGIGGILYPTGDEQVDMEKVRAIYDPVAAKNPEKKSIIMLEKE